MGAGPQPRALQRDVFALAQVEPPNTWLPARSSSIHAFGAHPSDAAAAAPDLLVPRLTPEWWNRVLLAQDPTEGLREVARRSLAVDEHGNKVPPHSRVYQLNTPRLSASQPHCPARHSTHLLEGCTGR